MTAGGVTGGDQPHDRKAYLDWLTTKTATHNQFQTRSLLPYYLYLATTGAFFENHCSQFGTNSTPNHLVLVGERKGSPNVVGTDRFVAEAEQGPLPPLVFVWHVAPQDEHPPADVTVGRKAVWQRIDAVVRGRGWDDTVFLLTYDDRGAGRAVPVPPVVLRDGKTLPPPFDVELPQQPRPPAN